MNNSFLGALALVMRMNSFHPDLAWSRHLVVALLLAQSQAAFAQAEHDIPLVISASNAGQQGFVRIINHSNRPGTVRIHAIDDRGRHFGPVSLSLDAKEAMHPTDWTTEAIRRRGAE